MTDDALTEHLSLVERVRELLPDAARVGNSLVTDAPLVFRKGLNLKHEVAHVLAESYHSDLVGRIKDADFRYTSDRLTLHLAREVGFWPARRAAADALGTSCSVMSTTARTGVPLGMNNVNFCEKLVMTARKLLKRPQPNST